MPELPEVETVVRGLRTSLPGRAIRDVRLGKTDFIDDPAALAEHLPGKKFVEIQRIGKFICIGLQTETQNASMASSRLLVHLGMTGRLRTCDPNDPIAPHTHCFFGLDNGQELRYTDPRRFGRMLLVPESGMPEFQAQLGAEPLEISRTDFVTQFKGRAARVKALLLDQRVVRGVGNIYADESLFRARIHPARIAGALSNAQLTALHSAMRQILSEAIRLRGSSVSNYVDANGEKGEFQQRHRVYQREGKPCSRCKTPIRRIIVAGRSSHFCPKCQPPPRKLKSPRKRATK